MVDLVMWLMHPGRQLLSEHLSCPHCHASKENDLLFGEPRYDPDATVKPEPYPEEKLTSQGQAVKAVEAAAKPESSRQEKLRSAGRVVQIAAPDIDASADKENLHTLPCNANTQVPLQSADYLPEAAKQVVQDRIADAAAEPASELAQEIHTGHVITDEQKEGALQPSSGGLFAIKEEQEEALAEPLSDEHRATATTCTYVQDSDVLAQISGPGGLLKRCQGLWYSETGEKIGCIEDDQVNWCEHTFDGEPCRLSATSATSISMELDGETHIAEFHEGSPERLVWSDGEVWHRN